MKRPLITLFLAAALAFFTCQTQAVSLPIMHSPSSGSNYVAYTDYKTWTQANTFCRQKQGHLAVYNSNSELMDIKKYLELVPASYWLGYTQTVTFNISTVTGQAVFSQRAGLPEFDSLNPFEGGNFRLNASSDGSSNLQWITPVIGLTGFVCEFEDSPL